MKRKKMFDRMMEGANEALDFANGTAARSAFRVHVPPDMDVRALRKRLGLSQPDFAGRFGFNVASVRDWEQGRSHPDSAVRAYLLVISRDHEAVERALTAA